MVYVSLSAPVLQNNLHVSVHDRPVSYMGDSRENHRGWVSHREFRR